MIGAETVRQFADEHREEIAQAFDSRDDAHIELTPAKKWPEPLDPAAFHGVAGEVVRTIEPHTEADPAAVLVQFLVSAGAMLGRNVYRIADGAHHRASLFAVLVGETARGRKGSSFAQISRLLRLADPEFVSDRQAAGLNSGEGVTWHVRDPIERREPIRERGRATGEYQVVEVDPGVDDKRLLVVESEFSSVLKVATREGNTLSPTIRQSWDSGDLRTLTKNSPAKATGAHIAIIGHITAAELLRHLDNTEVASGLANRFLWVCVRRSKILPFGGNLDASDFGRSVVRLHAAKEWGRDERELVFSVAARDAWSRVYPDLSAGRPGLLGAVLARAEAQVLRLAILYAALECSPTIELPHLEAGLAVWEY
jgi:hypothetical protein